MTLRVSEPILEPIVRKVRFREILRHIKPRSTVVDIGCGHTPHLLNRLERYIKDGVGIDPLIFNQKRGNIRLFSQFLADKIPLKSNSADHVTLAAVLEHLENPDSILKESYRILKPKGTIILTTPSHLNKPVLEILSSGLGLISTREIAEHKRYYWKKELIDSLKKAGFKNIKHHYFELFLNNFAIAEK